MDKDGQSSSDEAQQRRNVQFQSGNDIYRSTQNMFPPPPGNEFELHNYDTPRDSFTD